MIVDSFTKDEVLAHRLGLLPLCADPRLFQWKAEDAEDAGGEEDTLQYQLQVITASQNSKLSAHINELRFVVPWTVRPRRWWTQTCTPGTCRGCLRAPRPPG